MIFRDIDYSRDVPEIVGLLKTSLSDKHSVPNFLWKHFENPFGKSYGLLACENNRIIGVRMFMYWEFSNKNNKIKAIRPVDTITHPEYRGRGIFKELTLQGLKNISDQYDLIFNTPNSNSFPGYVKLGWQEYQTPLRYFISLIIPSWDYSKSIYFFGKNEEGRKNTEISGSDFFRTNLTPEYLNWRFKSDEYSNVVYEENGFSLLVIYRLKKINGMLLFILVDFVGEETLLKKALRGLAAKLNFFLVYHLEQNTLSSLKKRVGKSRVVYKDDKRNIHQKLSFSLGDLEGRL